MDGNGAKQLVMTAVKHSRAFVLAQSGDEKIEVGIPLISNLLKPQSVLLVSLDVFRAVPAFDAVYKPFMFYYSPFLRDKMP